AATPPRTAIVTWFQRVGIGMSLFLGNTCGRIEFSMSEGALSATAIPATGQGRPGGSGTVPERLCLRRRPLAMYIRVSRSGESRGSDGGNRENDAYACGIDGIAQAYPQRRLSGRHAAVRGAACRNPTDFPDADSR